MAAGYVAPSWEHDECYHAVHFLRGVEDRVFDFYTAEKMNGVENLGTSSSRNFPRRSTWSPDAHKPEPFWKIRSPKNLPLLSTYPLPPPYIYVAGYVMPFSE